ncbi:membrane protein [Streptomyces paromomycinus]|uniref:Membrane protein n=1 Tax=Streptomyces paromomycinus TaxID=92743 RepID=A0A401WG76_STREY|nr:membrane protein [Streptomyces paromomycinus]
MRLERTESVGSVESAEPVGSVSSVGSVDEERARRHRPGKGWPKHFPSGSRARAGRPPHSLTYVPFGERPLRRLPQLFTGLALYGFSLSVLIRAELGVSPWSVLYEGLARHTSLSFGTISAVVGLLVLLLWIPLRQRPTFGTGANIVVLACASDLGLHVLPQHLGLPARSGLLAGGIALNGLSVALYVGARYGPGPRDGLMTGMSAVTGHSLRSVRTLIEVTVLAVGRLLGGGVGVGTVLYALAVGPVTQFFVARFAYRSAAEDRA